MIIYQAGNFPQMNNLKAEEKMKEFVFKKGYPGYYRLVSFFHNKGAVNILKVKEMHDEKTFGPGDNRCSKSDK